MESDAIRSDDGFLPVCHLIHDLRPGGAEHVLVDLAQVAPQVGLGLQVVSMMPLGDFSYPRMLRELGVAVSTLGLASRWDPRGPGRLIKLLARERPALVHSHLKHADLLGGLAAGRLGLPHVSTLHLIESEVGVIGRFKRDLAARRRIRTAATTIAVSGAVRDWYLGAFPADPSQVVVIPNGIPDPGPTAPPASAALRAAFDGGRDCVVAAVVAVMRIGKGHDDVLDAAAGLPDRVRFVLAGSGPEEGRLRRRAEKMGLGNRVIFLGWREDISTVLGAADLIVHPSHADALATALIHGQASGLPAVATRVGGIPEIVTEETGRLVGPGDPEALRREIAALADDPDLRTRMGRAARARYLGHFEGLIWARRLRSVYDSIPNRAAPPRW